MDPRQSVLDGAVARGDLPFVVAMTASAARLHWAGAAGDVGPDSRLRMFSVTKAVGGLALMILVDRGIVDLDTPVEAILPDFASLDVLTGWDGETPRLRKPATRATLRQLASHTSGLAYTHWNADMRRYRAAQGLPSMASGRRAALFYPLAADPGTAWHYGMGLDWLGLALEAMTGQGVEAFCAAEIFGPLGLEATSFVQPPDLAPAYARCADGGFAALAIAPPAAPEFHSLGDGLFATPADILRLLRALLGGGALDGTRILSGAATRQLLANQIGDLRVAPMRSTSARISADVELLPGTPKSHSLIGQRSEADAPGLRRAGSSGWAGLLNTHWWLDPASRRAGVFMTQALPFADPRIMRVFAEFERTAQA